MNALRYSEESTEMLNAEGRMIQNSYISFHETASESHSQLQTASDKSKTDKNRESEAALKWEKLAYDHYVIIQGEELGRERESQHQLERGMLKNENDMHSEHLEAKTREMMMAAHGEHEQHQLMLSEVKQVHVQSMTRN